jgi:hypothetical protein
MIICALGELPFCEMRDIQFRPISEKKVIYTLEQINRCSRDGLTG